MRLSYFFKLIATSEYNLRKAKVILENNIDLNIEEFVPGDQLIGVRPEYIVFRKQLLIADIDWALSWQFQIKLLLIGLIILLIQTWVNHQLGIQ